MKNIKRSVGNFMDNEEDDVLRVKKALNETGFRDGFLDNGIIERETDTAIKKFQKEKGLRIDGVLMPDGETETELRGEVFKQRILLAAADDVSKGNKIRKKVDRFGEFARETKERARRRREEEDRIRQKVLDNEDPMSASELARQKADYIPNALKDIRDSFLSSLGLDLLIEGEDEGDNKR